MKPPEDKIKVSDYLYFELLNWILKYIELARDDITWLNKIELDIKNFKEKYEK